MDPNFLKDIFSHLCFLFVYLESTGRSFAFVLTRKLKVNFQFWPLAPIT